MYIVSSNVNNAGTSQSKAKNHHLKFYIAENYRGVKLSRICNFFYFAETIFTDAVKVTPNVHNYTEIFTRNFFEVEDPSSKNNHFAPRKFCAIQYM